MSDASIGGRRAGAHNGPRNALMRIRGLQGVAADRKKSCVPIDLQFRPGMSRSRFAAGASHFLWSGGNTTNLPIEEVGPMFVFNTAFDGEQRAGARFRPETPNPAQPGKMGCALSPTAAPERGRGPSIFRASDPEGTGACISWTVLTPRRWRVDLGTATPTRFLSLRLAASSLLEPAASAQMPYPCAKSVGPAYIALTIRRPTFHGALLHPCGRQSRFAESLARFSGVAKKYLCT